MRWSSFSDSYDSSYYSTPQLSQNCHRLATTGSTLPSESLNCSLSPISHYYSCTHQQRNTIKTCDTATILCLATLSRCCKNCCTQKKPHPHNFFLSPELVNKRALSDVGDPDDEDALVRCARPVEPVRILDTPAHKHSITATMYHQSCLIYIFIRTDHPDKNNEALWRSCGFESRFCRTRLIAPSGQNSKGCMLKL